MENLEIMGHFIVMSRLKKLMEINKILKIVLAYCTLCYIPSSLFLKLTLNI